METENLRYQPTWESFTNKEPKITIYENDNYVVQINNNSVELVFKAYMHTDTELDQMQIRQLYNNQGNKITLKNILNNIEEQYKIYE